MIPEAISIVSVTWPIDPAMTPKSFVPHRSLSHSVLKPRRSASTAWPITGRGSGTRPGSVYAPTAGRGGRPVPSAGSNAIPEKLAFSSVMGLF